MNKRQIALWASYDFAITILELNVAIYLSEWLVIDQGVSELLYSSVLALSIILALLILPVLGLISDRYQKRLPYLYFFPIPRPLPSFCWVILGSRSIINQRLSPCRYSFYHNEYFLSRVFAFLQCPALANFRPKIARLDFRIGRIGRIPRSDYRRTGRRRFCQRIYPNFPH